MKIEDSVEEKYLKTLLDNRVQVYIFLKSGIKLTGRIVGMSQKVIFLGEPVAQMIYKKYISTIVDPSTVV